MDALWQQLPTLNPVVLILAGVPLLGLALLLGQIGRRETAIRGARLTSPDLLCRLYWHFRAHTGELLTLGGKPISRLDETKHFKLIGTTGTGKSTAISALLRGSPTRMVATVRGSSTPAAATRYSTPFAPQSAKWEPLAELEDAADPEHLASALIATSADATASEWRGYARTLRGCNA